ncbi:radical SAM/SPASM domain-containing protein [Endothiovibrio diazotrophicus]
MSDETDTTIGLREQNLREKWTEVNERIPVSRVQFRFDTDEREKAFIEKQFLTDDERERYRWYREEWHRRPKEGDAGDFPLAVCCELVSTCDLACTMCYTISDDFKNAITGAQRIMPWPVAKAVIDECAELGVPSLLLSWRGEPTMYKWKDGDREVTFPDVVKYARDKGILEITAITHGQRIDDKMAEALVDAEPSWISFSIDGLEADYNKIRTPPKYKDDDEYDAFSAVIGNIRRLVAARNAKGKNRPQVRTNSIYPAIANNKERYRELLLEAGVDLLTINEIVDLRPGDLPPEAIDEHWGCQYPFQRLTVTANGIMLPCTTAYYEQSAMVLGRYVGAEPKRIRNVDGTYAEVDVPECTLKSAWHGERIVEMRKLHLEGRRTEIVPGCRDCNQGAVRYGYDRIPEQWDMEKMDWKGGKRVG